MLWLGGPLDTVGVVSRVGSQTDLARTLLYQLNIDASRFIFPETSLPHQRNTLHTTPSMTGSDYYR